MHLRQKSAVNILRYLIGLSLWLACDCVRLRAQSESQPPPAAAPPQRVQDFEPSEWTVKNIIGLAGILLLVMFMIASFAFMGSWKSNKTAKLKILQVMLVDDIESKPDPSHEENNSGRPELPLAAVIKVNSEHPVHHVMPLTEEGSQISSANSCAFDVDQTRFETTSFSLIIREGNIPIHFETINGGKFLKAAQSKRLELRNVQENEVKLRGKKIVIVFDINR